MIPAKTKSHPNSELGEHIWKSDPKEGNGFSSKRRK